MKLNRVHALMHEHASEKDLIIPVAELYEPESGGQISNLVRFFQDFGQKLDQVFSTQCLTDKYQRALSRIKCSANDPYVLCLLSLVLGLVRFQCTESFQRQR